MHLNVEQKKVDAEKWNEFIEGAKDIHYKLATKEDKLEAEEKYAYEKRRTGIQSLLRLLKPMMEAKGKKRSWKDILRGEDDGGES